MFWIIYCCKCIPDAAILHRSGKNKLSRHISFYFLKIYSSYIKSFGTGNILGICDAMPFLRGPHLLRKKHSFNYLIILWIISNLSFTFELHRFLKIKYLVIMLQIIIFDNYLVIMLTRRRYFPHMLCVYNSLKIVNCAWFSYKSAVFWCIRVFYHFIYHANEINLHCRPLYH